MYGSRRSPEQSSHNKISLKQSYSNYLDNEVNYIPYIKNFQRFHQINLILKLSLR